MTIWWIMGLLSPKAVDLARIRRKVDSSQPSPTSLRQHKIDQPWYMSIVSPNHTTFTFIDESLQRRHDATLECYWCPSFHLAAIPLRRQDTTNAISKPFRMHTATLSYALVPKGSTNNTCSLRRFPFDGALWSWYVNRTEKREASVLLLALRRDKEVVLEALEIFVKRASLAWRKATTGALEAWANTQ